MGEALNIIVCTWLQWCTVQYSTDFRFHEIFDSCKVNIVMEGNIKSIEQREDQLSKAEVA